MSTREGERERLVRGDETGETPAVEDGRASEENAIDTSEKTTEAATQLDSHSYETQNKWGTRRS